MHENGNEKGIGDGLRYLVTLTLNNREEKRVEGKEAEVGMRMCIWYAICVFGIWYAAGRGRTGAQRNPNRNDARAPGYPGYRA